MQWVDTLDFVWDSLPEGDKVGLHEGLIRGVLTGGETGLVCGLRILLRMKQQNTAPTKQQQEAHASIFFVPGLGDHCALLQAYPAASILCKSSAACRPFTLALSLFLFHTLMLSTARPHRPPHHHVHFSLFTHTHILPLMNHS